MREFSVPATYEVGPDEALTDLLATNVAEHGDEVGLRRRVNGAWQDVTWKQFGTEVADVAKGLIASGVNAGDRVALQAKTRYEWTVIDFAIWTAGGVVVPIYDSSSADQVAWILSDSGATTLIVETAEQFVGLHYLWGGLSRWGYDCSGLTWAAYRAHGITIPRDADAQFAAGRPVPLARMLPGDLGFYEHPVVGHVAMYIGGGKMIEAPTSRSDVRIVPLRTSDFRGVRRFVGV